MNCNWPLCSMIHNEIESLSPPLKADLQYVICFGQEMLWGGRFYFIVNHTAERPIAIHHTNQD